MNRVRKASGSVSAARRTGQARVTGRTDVLRPLQAQRTLIETDLEYIEADYARWTAAATIAGLLQLE